MVNVWEGHDENEGRLAWDSGRARFSLAREGRLKIFRGREGEKDCCSLSSYAYPQVLNTPPNRRSIFCRLCSASFNAHRAAVIYVRKGFECVVVPRARHEKCISWDCSGHFDRI